MSGDLTRDLKRALAVLRLSNAQRMARVNAGDPEVFWFLENIDELAPQLLALGWAVHVPFTETPGEVVVSDGSGAIYALALSPAMV